MAERRFRILLVVPDAARIEHLMGPLSPAFDAAMTCVAEAESALEIEMTSPHDLVIVERGLLQDDGLVLAERLCAVSRRPVILLCDTLETDEVIRAMRSGVCDIYCRPFAIDELVDGVRRALYAHETRRQSGIKYRRMRELVRRVIRERRELNRRIELLCRDLVEGHRRLVRKFLERRATPTERPSS